MDSLALVHDGRCTTAEGVSIRLQPHHIYMILMSVASVNSLWAGKKETGKGGKAHREQAQKSPRTLYHWTSHKHPVPLQSR